MNGENNTGETVVNSKRDTPEMVILLTSLGGQRVQLERVEEELHELLQRLVGPMNNEQLRSEPSGEFPSVFGELRAHHDSCEMTLKQIENTLEKIRSLI